ncbi:MAG: NAD-dependent epimerase/dehydratase family protein [Planctomycetota bacterium]|nr:NAD-dependent epimerase/dehydratase family protein [Planctomycetota bacterium]
MNRLIVGCGYVGSEIARIWLAKGDSVYAITRSTSRVEELKRLGIQPVVWDWYRPSVSDNLLVLPKIDSVVVCVSHAPVEGITPEKTHTLGLDNLLHHWLHDSEDGFPACWCYVSTTGVYAPRDDGGWVDEEAEVLPLRPGSIAAKAAEDWFEREIFSRVQSGMANNALLHGCILRAAGIYGPGRIPRLDVLINNEPIAIDPESYLNLIHVVDLAGIVASVFDGLTPHRMYNVADGNPVRRRDYYDFIARQIGSLPPRFEFANKQIQIMNSPVHAFAKVQSDASTSKPAARSRGEGSKRIRTDLLKESVPYSFQFPNFQAGLTPLLPK